MKLQIPNIDRVVLLGGGNLLIALARWCIEQGIPISIVTSPRHSEELAENNISLKNVLEREKISFLITEDIGSPAAKDFLADLSKAFCLSLGAAWIFKKEIISSLFKNHLFNLHGTRLPQNRGGGGFSWQIMMGNKLGFCQLHLVDSGVDTGDIIRTKEFLYPPECRKPIHYANVYSEKNLKFLADFIEEIRTSGIVLDTKKQSEYFSTYWPRLNTKDNAWIDWNEPLGSLERFICAFDDPYEGAKTFLNGKRVFIKDVSADYSDPQFHPYQAGIVYRKNKHWMSICANGGTLIVETIVDEDGKILLPKLKPGDRLSTPSAVLDKRTKRPIYTPTGLKD